MKILFTLVFLFFITTSFGQKHFDLTVDFPQINHNPNPNFEEIKPINHNEVNKIFDKVNSKSGIEFNYPQGGCPERAIITNYVLDSLGVDNFKIWLFAPSRLIQGDKRQIFVFDKNKLTDDYENKIKWDFHVAACILRENSNGKIDTLVIDPSIAKKPLTSKEWLKSINGLQDSKYTYTKGKFYSFNKKNNGNSNVINGYFYEYSGFSYNQLWLEKMLALNDVAYKMYQDYLLDDSLDINVKNDLKSVIGNSATFKEVLSFNDGIPNQSKIFYLVKNHPKFINECWDLYQKQIVLWRKRIVGLKK
jgi:hypothetical protein